MNLKSLIAAATLIAFIACGTRPSRGDQAVKAHEHMVQALLAYNEQRKADFSSDPKMIQQMDALSREIRHHQGPKRFASAAKEDALVDLVAKDTAELQEFFQKRIFDLGLSQPMAMITPERREVLKTLDTYYKGFLTAMQPDAALVNQLERQVTEEQLRRSAK